MIEIIPNLWLGNIKARNNVGFLTSRKIRCIINCCAPDIIDRYSIASLPPHVHQVHLSIIEHGPNDPVSIESMRSKLHGTVELIDHYLNKCQGVLVHCYAGRQRSPTIIMAYLINKCNFTIEQAYSIVSALWPCTGDNYMKALELTYA